ncbi:hypothetical protein IWX47DRAFT_622746 [Phyllosticta citricarpa]
MVGPHSRRTNDGLSTFLLFTTLASAVGRMKMVRSLASPTTWFNPLDRLTESRFLHISAWTVLSSFYFHRNLLRLVSNYSLSPLPRLRYRIISRQALAPKDLKWSTIKSGSSSSSRHSKATAKLRPTTSQGLVPSLIDHLFTSTCFSTKAATTRTS